MEAYKSYVFETFIVISNDLDVLYFTEFPKN